jgi:predicted nucleotidyltransferase component of viral defense system
MQKKVWHVIEKKWMPEKTRALFEAIFNKPQLNNFVLMGGTALSIQIGHRLSEDLDFAFFSDTLPKDKINNLLTELKASGFNIQSLIPQNQISQARINGLFLLDYVQDYSIDGAKLSFFTFDKGGSKRKAYFSKAPRKDIGSSFKIFDVNEIFESKCVVLRDRIKSRDLFDLMYLMKNYHFTVNDIFNSINRIDTPSEGVEPIKEILVGNVPIDKNDPGLLILKDKISVEDIYLFFKEEIDKYEIEQAKIILKSIEDKYE